MRENRKSVAGKREQSTFQARESEKPESNASQGLCMSTTALCWHSRYSEMDPTLSIQTHFVLQPLLTAHTPATPNKSSLQQHTLVFHTALQISYAQTSFGSKTFCALGLFHPLRPSLSPEGNSQVKLQLAQLPSLHFLPQLLCESLKPVFSQINCRAETFSVPC